MTAIKYVVWAVLHTGALSLVLMSLLQHQKLKMSLRDFQVNAPSQPLDRDMYNIGHYVMTC